MPPRSPSRWLFWTSAGALAYAYAGFSLVAVLRGVLRARPVAAGGELPAVTVIIAAYNESGVIGQKLASTMALDYPKERLEVIVASDGSSDGTAEEARRWAADGVRLLDLPRRGKNLALNDATAAARGDILVFTDADTMLPADALRHLVAPFADADVGGVAGERRHADHLASRRKRALWAGKRTFRRQLSRAGSVTAAEGQLHAIRRELFRPLPPDVNDDFFISAQAVAAHRRLVYEPRAASYPVAGGTAVRAPFGRKVRQTERWLRAVLRMRRLMNPFEHGFFAIQLVSHKVLRRLAFAPLLVLAVTAPALWGRARVYRVATLAQVALHGAAALGFVLRRRGIRRAKLLRPPLAFDMANAAALVAVVRTLRRQGAGEALWAPQRVSPAGDA